VIFFHYDAFLVFHGFPRLIDTNISSIIPNGYLWVDFFFILSGFVICHVYGEKLKPRNWSIVKKYLWARFSRLYPLHAFIMIIFVIRLAILIYAFPDYAAENWANNATIFNFLVYFFFLQTTRIIENIAWNVPSWSIAAEWWTYIIAVILIPFLNKGNYLKITIFTILALLGLLTISILESGLDTIFEFGTLRCVFGFTIGIGIYQAYKIYRVRESIWNKDFMIYITVLCSLLVLHFDLYDVIVIPFFSMFILSASLNKGVPCKLLNTKPMVFLGDISYSIYLIHVFWLTIWWMWLDLYFIPTNPGVMPSALNHLTWLTTIFGIIIYSSYLTYHYVELPGQKKLRRCV